MTRLYYPPSRLLYFRIEVDRREDAYTKDIAEAPLVVVYTVSHQSQHLLTSSCQALWWRWKEEEEGRGMDR